MSFDPTKLIRTPDGGDRANGEARGARWGWAGADQVSDAGIWEANTETPLAAMLYAASPAMGAVVGARAESWVLLAVFTMVKADPDVVLTLVTEPGWAAAAEIVRDIPLFANALARTLDMDACSMDRHRADDAQGGLSVKAAAAGEDLHRVRGVVRRPGGDAVCAVSRRGRSRARR